VTLARLTPLERKALAKTAADYSGDVTPAQRNEARRRIHSDDLELFSALISTFEAAETATANLPQPYTEEMRPYREVLVAQMTYLRTIQDLFTFLVEDDSGPYQEPEDSPAPAAETASATA
jgi:hypothetical protein